MDGVIKIKRRKRPQNRTNPNFFTASMAETIKNTNFFNAVNMMTEKAFLKFKRKLKLFLANLVLMLLFPLSVFTQEEDKAKNPSIAVFVPPKDWRIADEKALSPHIKILVIGPKIQNEMPPTMNLMIEPYSGTLKSYLKNVKKINDTHGDAWKDLGTLKTKAGDASLSQVEIRSKWGGEKLMHAIIVRNGFAYVLTATAAKNEFGRFYQQFYNAFRSLQIYENLDEELQNVELIDLKDNLLNN